MMIEKGKTMKKVILQHKFWLVAVIFATAGLTTVELLKAFLMQYILDSATIGTMERLQTACFLTLGFLILMVLLGLLYDTVTGYFVRICMETVKAQWMHKIEKKRLCEYDVQKTSGYISHFTVDTASLEEDYLQNFFLILRYLMTGVASLVVIWNIHYYFVIFVLLTSWLPLLINRLWIGKITDSKLEASKSSGKFTGILKELLAGFEVSRMYGLSKHMEGTFQKENHELEKKRFWSRWTKSTCENTGGTASLLLWMGTLLLGTYLTLRNLITVGMVLQVNQLLNNLVNPLYRISFCLTKMKAENKIYEHVEQDLEDGNLPQETKTTSREPFSGFSNSIQVQSAGIFLREREILKDVNLCFEKGKKYLLTGESGSGKSTLLKTLLDYHKEYTGKILVDGHDLSNVQMENWYQSVAVVSQSDFLFHDTLRNNLCLFRGISEETIREVLKLCCLEKFVEAQKEGLDFMIEENGKNVSGGERQRICLARALLKEAPVLLLDEAMSALDSDTAFQIENNLLSMQGITMISISHKLFPELFEKYDGRIQFEQRTAWRTT